jgi:hypothetical protein
MKYLQELKEDETYLPITFQQFENLTNEMLGHINLMIAPLAVDGRIMAGVIMSIIHGLDKKTVIITKQEIFNRAVNLLSNQMSYQAVEAIKEQIARAAGETTLKSVPDELAE